MADIDVEIHKFRASSQQHSSEVKDVCVPSRTKNRSDPEHDMTPDLEKEDTALSCIKTQKSQNGRIVDARRKSRQSLQALPKMGAGKPYPPDLPAQEDYIVEFDGADDHTHPQNWSTNVKLVLVSLTQ
jgi:DHA1 family multidrug resistance protein-like MFS transporter